MMLGERPRHWNTEKYYSSVPPRSDPKSDDIMCSFSTNRMSVKATGRIQDILFFHMAPIIDLSMKVFIESVRGFPFIWQVQSTDYKALRMKENA